MLKRSAPPRAAFEARTRYTLSSRVVPGFAPARATRRRRSVLMRLDLPTLERPASAMTTPGPAGRTPPSATLVTNAPSRIFTARFQMGLRRL